MNASGSLPHRASVFLLLALCLGWNSRVAAPADLGHEPAASLDRLSILKHGVASLHPWQALGLDFALSDFDGDHKVDVAVGRHIGNDYAIVIHFTSHPGETVLEFSHMLPSLTVFAYDINKDSCSDIVIASPFDAHPLAVWLGDGTGSFSAADQTRFTNDIGFNASPSYDRKYPAFQQDLLSDPRRLDCEERAFGTGDLNASVKRPVAFAYLPFIQRTAHSLLGPRSPPDLSLYMTSVED